MGRVSSYKKPKAANDPERYEKFLFGERYNNAPTKGKQKMSVSEKRQRRLMARVQGKPDPFAEPAKNQSTVDSGKATQTKAKTTNGSSEAQTESQDSDSDSENAAATGPQTEAESEANEDEAPRKVARIAQSVDGSSQQTASDRALNAKISADVKRREGETMKEYKNRLKRETNRVIKATNKQAQKRTAKSKAYFANKKAEEKRKREERQAEQAEKLAEKILPVVPHGAVNDRPPAIEAFKKRMQKRLQKVMTHSASNAKHKGLSSIEAYRAQVQDAYKNMKLKQAHTDSKQQLSKKSRSKGGNFKRKFAAGAFD